MTSARNFEGVPCPALVVMLCLPREPVTVLQLLFMHECGRMLATPRHCTSWPRQLDVQDNSLYSV